MKIREIWKFCHSGLVFPVIAASVAFIFYSCSTFNYKTYDQKLYPDVDDPEPDYNITLDKDFQDYTNFMFIGNRIENFGSYFNTYYNARENFDDAYDDYNTRILANYGNRIDSIYINQPLSQEAIDLFNKAIEKASRVIQYHKSSALMDRAVLLIGRCYFYLGDYIKAERKFSEFASKLSRSSLADENLLFYSKTQLRLGNYEVALQRLQNLINSTGSTSVKADAYQSIAEYYLSKKDYEVAVDNYRKAIEYSTDSQFKSEMQFLLATVIAQNDFGRAADEFDKVLDFSPTYQLQFYARLNRLKYLILAGDFNTAFPLIDNLRVKYKDDADLLQQVDFLHGFYYDKKKEFKKAFEVYKRVIQDYPKTAASSNASYCIGKYYENETHDYMNALRYYRYSTEESGMGQYHNDAVAKTDLFKKYYDLRSEIAGAQINTEYDSLFYVNTKGKTEQNINPNNNGNNPGIENPPDKGSHGNGKGGGFQMAFPDSIDVIKTDSLPSVIQNDSNGVNKVSEKEPVRKKKGSIKDSVLSKMREKGDTSHMKTQTDTNQTKEETKIDSTQIKAEKIAKAKFELAELFDYEFKRPDSSEYYYLSAFEESGDYDFRSRVLYALAGLYTSEGKEAKAHETLKRIISEYPLSPLTKQAKIELNIPIEDVSSDASDSLFNASESEFDNSDYSSALQGYTNLLSEYPSSVHWVKSCYSAGWIYENVLHKSDSAYDCYSKVIVTNPKCEYAAAISGKVKEYEEAMKQALDTTGAKDSSGVKQNGMKSDSLTRSAVNQKNDTVAVNNGDKGKDGDQKKDIAPGDKKDPLNSGENHDIKKPNEDGTGK